MQSSFFERTDTRKNLTTVHFPPFIFLLGPAPETPFNHTKAIMSRSPSGRLPRQEFSSTRDVVSCLSQAGLPRSKWEWSFCIQAQAVNRAALCHFPARVVIPLDRLGT